MKITRKQLRQLIKEELTESSANDQDRAKHDLFRLLDAIVDNVESIRDNWHNLNLSLPEENPYVDQNAHEYILDGVKELARAASEIVGDMRASESESQKQVPAERDPGYPG